MKAIAITPHTNKNQLIEIPEPQIETATQIKARVLEVGICGTDREEISGGRADAPPGESQLIIGHEMLGEVVEVGSEVKNLRPKDLVVIMVRRPCAHCEMCRLGRSDMCQTGDYTERGIKGRHGFHAEFVVDEEQYAFKVPLEAKSVAVMTEPTTVVEKAIDEMTRIQASRIPGFSLSGRTVLVAGLGPIGLLGAMVLLLRGAKVTGIDVVPPDSTRVRLLKAMGGEYVQECKNRRFDCILEAAGVAKLDFSLIDALGINGAYALTGVPGASAPIAVDAASLMRNLVLNNQVIIGSVNASHDHFRQAILDLEAAQKKWKGVIEQLITSRTPKDDFSKEFNTRNHEEIKAVISWTL